MITNEIKAEVVQLLSELFVSKGFDADVLSYVDLVDDMGMDSITFISIIVEIEAKFNITIPDDILLIDSFRKADDIINVVEYELMKGDKKCDGSK